MAGLTFIRQPYLFFIHVDPWSRCWGPWSRCWGAVHVPHRRSSGWPVATNVWLVSHLIMIMTLSPAAGLKPPPRYRCILQQGARRRQFVSTCCLHQFIISPAAAAPQSERGPCMGHAGFLCQSVRPEFGATWRRLMLLSVVQCLVQPRVVRVMCQQPHLRHSGLRVSKPRTLHD